MAPSRIRVLKFFAFVALMMFLHPSAAHTQTPRPRSPGASTDIKWDIYTFRFFKGNQMGQVLDADGHVLASILSMNGGLQLIPSVTGADADKLKKSFEDWKAQGGEKALNSATPPTSAGNRPHADSATTRGSAASTRPDASATPDPQPHAKASATPPSTAAGPAAGFKYGILDAAAVNKFGKGGALRLDLNLLRLDPALLDQKFFMRYFIALNNCNDQHVAQMLDNELDYPDLAALYQPKAQPILNRLPMVTGAALYNGAGLWKKLLTLGEYDKSKGSFPILYPGQADGAEIPATISFEFGNSQDRAACAIVNNIIANRTLGALPSAYSISIKPMSFKEFAIDEAGARKYIQDPGGSQRAVILLVDIRLLDVPPSYRRSASGAITGVNFSGEVAKVTLAKANNGEAVGVLYDNHSLPQP
jgi:hypothetical protein